MRKSFHLLLTLAILLLACAPAFAAGTAPAASHVAENPQAAAPPPVAESVPAAAPAPVADAPPMTPAEPSVAEPLFLSESPPPGGCSYRWVIGGGCCHVVWGYSWREKEQKNCTGSWVDTGATRCTNYPCG